MRKEFLDIACFGREWEAYDVMKSISRLRRVNLPLLFILTINFTSLRSTTYLPQLPRITYCPKGEFKTRSLVTSRFCPHLLLFFWNSAQDEQAKKYKNNKGEDACKSPNYTYWIYLFLMTLARTWNREKVSINLRTGKYNKIPSRVLFPILNTA